MAQNSKSEGLCQKLLRSAAVSPFRPRIRRVSDQPPPEKNSVKNTSSESKPVHHALHESITIPVEFKHFTPHVSKECDENEVAVVRGHKFAKSASGNDDGDDEPVHEGKFSDYISNFKNRMVKTASRGGSMEFNKER